MRKLVEDFDRNQLFGIYVAYTDVYFLMFARFFLP